MGNSNRKGLSRQMQAKRATIKQIPEQYRPCFNQLTTNPNFIHELLTQNQKISQNLVKHFPNAINNYQQFTQMVLFFIKSQAKLSKNQFINHNASNTNLLDRFFMVILDVQKWEQLQQMQMDNSHLEALFLQFMKLFISNPKPGFVTKLKNYLGLANNPTISIKSFTSKLLQSFPSINKYMRDYTITKFRDMKQTASILSNFRSDILYQDAIILALKLPELTKPQIKLLYSSQTSGISFHAYCQRIIGYGGPWLLLIQSMDKQIYKFGTYQSGPILDIVDYQGNLQGFLFTIEPNIRFMTTDKGEQSNHYFFINSVDERISKRRKGIGFGGDQYKDNCKLWIDQDLDKSTVYNGNDPTYGYGCLGNPQSNHLAITKMEIWGLGSMDDLAKQAEYWKQRENEAMKRRKVSKQQFIDGNAALMFGTILDDIEKTFAYRDQVVGEIERSNKKIYE